MTDFDRIIDRKESNAAKWDAEVLRHVFGSADLLPFWVADMDFASPRAVSNALAEKAEHGIFGYPATSRHFLQAWQGWTRNRHRWDVPLNRAIFVPGIVSAMSLGISLFSREKDGVILQEPVYQPFRNLIVRNNRTPVVNPLQLRGGRFAMDFADLEEKASRKETSLFLLCSPHNPGGRVWTREELEEAHRICRKHGVFVISDEIHADLTLGGSPAHTPYSSLSPEAALGGMTCQAPSKTFNVAGEKLSIAVLADKEKRKRFKEELLRLNLHEGSALALVIGEAAYARGEDWLEELLSYLRGNIELIEGFLKEKLPGVTLMKPDAGFIGWLDFRRSGWSHKALEERFIRIGGIAMMEGLWFGQGGEGFFRLNYGCPRPLLEEGLEKISASLADDLVHQDPCGNRHV